MKIRQKLLTIIEQLTEDKLAILLNLAFLLKSGKESVQPMLVSQAYQDWLSAENDIYDEIFADELRRGDVGAHCAPYIIFPLSEKSADNQAKHHV